MANYQLLKVDIDAKVYQNGKQEITGANLNSVLNAMVTTLGAEYQFAGVATIDTTPGTPDAKVFYIANGKGTYTNFGGIEVTENEVVVLYWDSAWHKVATGIASQAKLSELEEEITNYKTVEFNKDGYLNNDGTLAASSNVGALTDFISVVEGDTLVYTGGIGTMYACICGYSEKVGSSGISGNPLLVGGDYTGKEIIVPSGCNYIRVCARSANPHSLLIKTSQVAKNAKDIITINKEIKPSTIYNVNVANGNPSGTYTFSSAIATIPIESRKFGMAVTYRLDSNNYDTYQFVKGDVSDTYFLDIANWQKLVTDKTFIATLNNYKKKNVKYRVELQGGGLDTENGKIRSTLSSMLQVSTPKFIELNPDINQRVTLTLNGDYVFKILYYDKNKTFLGTYEAWQTSGADVGAGSAFPSARFIKILCRKSNSTLCELNVTGELDFNIDTIAVEESYNTSLPTETNSNDGVITIQSWMKISNPNCCDANSTSVQDNNNKIYANYGVLRLPESYKDKGEATPLIIFCHGSAVHYDGNSSIIASSSGLAIDYLLAEGYAIMDVDGNLLSDQYTHCGSPMGIQAYVNGLNWVQKRYNVTKKVYLAGHSLGGMTAGILANVGEAFPVNALCLVAPATSLLMMMQLVPSAKDAYADYFGLPSPRPSWTITRGDLSAEEKTYMFANFGKWAYTSLLWRNGTDMDFEDLSALDNKFINAPSSTENLFYANKHSIAPKIPTKIFQGSFDTSCYPQWSRIYADMVLRSGGMIEYRLMDGVSHSYISSTDKGIMEVGDNTVITKYGKTFTGVPTTQVEMIKFFDRYLSCQNNISL